MKAHSAGTRLGRRALQGAILCALCATEHAAAQSGANSAPPRDTESEQSSFVNRPLLAVGGVLFFGAYVPSLIYAKTSLYNNETSIKYPLVGPWLDLSAGRCSTDPCDGRHLSGGLLIADGLAQALGLLTIIAGLSIPEETTERWFSSLPLLVLPGRLSASAYGIRAASRF